MLHVEGLAQVYGDFVAVKDLTFSARPGELLGLLGPHDAGISAERPIADSCQFLCYETTITHQPRRHHQLDWHAYARRSTTDITRRR